MEIVPFEPKYRDDLSVRFRPAAEADLPALEAWDEHVSPEELRRLIPLGRVLVAGGNGEPLGWLRWGLFWDEIPFLNLLCILEPWQGRGLGGGLVRYWEEAQRKNGAKMVMTSTLADETAQHFYRKLGYTDAGCLLLPGEALEILFRKEL